MQALGTTGEGTYTVYVRSPFPHLGLPLLLFGACAPAPPQVRLGSLQRVDGTEAPPEEVVVTRMLAPSDPAEWVVSGGEARLNESPEARWLSLDGEQAHELSLEGEYTPGTWNVLALNVVARAELWLRAGLRRTSGPEPAVVGSSDVPHLRAGEARRVTFDLRGLDGHDASFEELLIAANGPDELAWDLVSVELVQRSPARWLPSIEEGPGPVRLGGEARHAVALSTGAPLEASCTAPEGAVLLFGAAPPPGVRMSSDTKVRVLLQDRPLAELPVDPEGWRDLRVELPGAVDGTLRFELADAGRNGAAALELPELFLPDPSAPTVLLVTSDTHRGDHVAGSPRDPGVMTPNLERLADRGIRFDDCFATSNITLPSHAALLTGSSPRETGVIDNRTPLHPEVPTLAEHFAARGFVTYASTSTKLLSPHWSGLHRGFDRHETPTDELARPGDATLETMEEWVASASGRPLFAWLHLYDAHRPYAPPSGWAEAYYPPGRDPFDPSAELGAPAVPGLPGVRDREWVHALYQGEVSWVDDLVGRLLEIERFEQGIIAFTADHGECLGDQGVWWDHLAAYPAVLHVPLILAWPGAPAGSRVEEPVRHTDLGRTLLGLAGLDSVEFPGDDLRRWLEPKAAAPEPRFAVSDEGQAVAISEEGWHLIVHLRAPEKPHLLTRDLLARPVELFDLRADPACMDEAGDREPERRARLARKLLAWVEAAPPPRSTSHLVDETSAEMLAGLGYGPGSEEASSSVGFIDLDLLRERLAPYLP